MYINGALDSIHPLESSKASLPTANIKMGSGLRSYYLGKGALDEFRIWNTIRTEQEILGNRNLELSTPYSNTLVKYYTFNQGTGGSNNSGITHLYNDVTKTSDGVLSNFALSGNTSNFVQLASLISIQLAPTSVTGVAPSSSANNDGKITGTTTEMEFKVSGGSWQTATQTEVTGLAAGTYEVRYAAKTGYYASPATSVTVPAYVPGSDATLSDLRVDGRTVSGFVYSTTTYHVVLPYGVTAPPAVTAAVTDMVYASYLVTAASALPGYTTVLVTAEDGSTTMTYTINFTLDNPPEIQSPEGIAATKSQVLVNDQIFQIGEISEEKVGDKTIITVKVDEDQLSQSLNQEGPQAVVQIPINQTGDVVVGQLNGHTVKNMEIKEAVLEIKTESVTYKLPASEINIDEVSTLIGNQVQLKDIKVSVSISYASPETTSIVESIASNSGFQNIVKPVDFEITCTSGEKTVEVSKFNAYVERTVAIPDGIDPSKITTGIVLNSDGTFSHVPTTITIVDGKYYAKINNLTNSTYSVIYNKVEFADVADHWAKAAVNDMGSRLVIDGIGVDDAGDNNFAPDRDITRAEFAAIMVRALGLKEADGTTEVSSAGASGSNAFKDIKESDWFSGYIKTAVEYGLIKGYDDGTFKPSNDITREEAMAIIARAMKWTGLKSEFRADELAALYSVMADTDSVATWAKDAVGACLKNGIVTGRDGLTIAPKASITRAEVAAIAQRLLKKSGLIN